MNIYTASSGAKAMTATGVTTRMSRIEQTELTTHIIHARTVMMSWVSSTLISEIGAFTHLSCRHCPEHVVGHTTNINATGRAESETNHHTLYSPNTMISNVINRQQKYIVLTQITKYI